MGEYCKPLYKSFTCRTNKIIQDYDGELDATILLNCLLGMLLIPFEKGNRKFKATQQTGEIDGLFCELQAGGNYNNYGNDYDSYNIVRCMRNAIAHFNVESYPDDGNIEGFIFKNPETNHKCEYIGEDCKYMNRKIENAPDVFNAKLSLNDIKKLAEIIKNQVLSIRQDAQCKNCPYC